MEDAPILFADERWQRLEADVAQIKNLLGQLLQQTREPNDDNEVLLTARQVSQWLGVDVATVYARCANHTLPHVKVGKRYKFRRSEIQNWMETSKVEEEINVDEFVNRYLQENLLRG
jgi:excisionase family DNA binding protein